MTEQEFLEAVDGLGCINADVAYAELGTKRGVALQFNRTGDRRKVRNAVRLPPGAGDEDAYPLLLEWAREAA